jgi:hypothetical protein
MKPLISVFALLSTLMVSSCSQATSTPEALAKALQAALDSGDFEAARKLADIDAAPAELHFFYFDTVRECSSEATCTVAATPANDEFRQHLKDEADQINAQAPRIDGLLAVALKSRDGSGSGTMEMPYAKRGDVYKLVSIQYSTDVISALRAKTSETLVQELFAQGIRDSGNSEPRTDWATAAIRLPGDGGEIGKAYVAQTTAMAAAVDAKDPDAAMRAGGQMAAIIFRDKDFEGKPIPLADRQRKLYVQSLRMLRDVKVEGGYRLGETAVLMIEARDGIGWNVRGPIVLAQEGDSWELAGKMTVAYPGEH